MATIVFDLDGTLADTSQDLLAAANHCFGTIGAGAVLTLADAATALRGGRAMLRLGMERLGHARGEDEIDRLYPLLLEAYAGAISVHTRLFPGAMQAVEMLRSQGHTVAICTNKPEGLARQLLTDLGIMGDFPALVGADTLTVRKPDPEPLREAVRRAGGDPRIACLVGDSDTDRNTARAAGVPSVLVTFGPSGEDMAALAPEALIGHFDELPSAVAGFWRDADLPALDGARGRA
ncbi:phosphoglycolate phosphatase [Pseudooceanicola batsensis HTCC2597]|uniref:phosphoglycolate phosphatase n=1 Tax=Pseudooceanicola batsensis (strain ATCC BAA-863 / DSM 15984 / KCTC 12145 / HTCC2597) TaxID=252305 RepID=A3U1K0_PSEBH|nr:HAD-IA family hydrolase [Pseudooceanicola batsensis]EAQ01781.1 phosphoglycolate phosphatase [Pseudooceanicola batsensis HTCC2597]